MLKSSKEKVPPDAELYEAILPTVVKNEELLQPFKVNEQISHEAHDDEKNFVTKGFSDDDNKKVSYINYFSYLWRV